MAHRHRRWIAFLPAILLLVLGVLFGVAFHRWSFAAPLVGGAIGATVAASTLR